MFCCPQNRRQRVAVLDIGGRDLALDRQAQLIHCNMPLPALDVLVAIDRAVCPLVMRLDRLGVDDGGAGVLLALGFLADAAAQYVQDAL